MKKDIDYILKHALAPEDEPDERLNRKILNQAEEMTHMARKRKNRIPAAILAASITLMIGSTAVFAAWKYLSPSQMAEKLDGGKLSEAFQGEDAVQINETQEYGGYKVTLLGVVAGENIGESVSLDWDGPGQEKENMFYAAIAIERADGTPMPDTSANDYGEESFFASPYIKGLDPVWYNAVTLGGGYGEFVENGIQYRLLEVDNVEMFADRGIYIGVSSGSFPDKEAYDFDESTGEITRNESYEGVNALFVLPLDPAKADPEAAQEILDHMWDEEEDENEPEELAEKWQEVDAFMEKLTAENLEEYAEVIELTVQVCKPDAQGNISYSWELEDGRGGSGTCALKDIFPEGRAGDVCIGGYSFSEEFDSLCIDIYVLNEDGTVTYAVYRPKMN